MLLFYGVVVVSELPGVYGTPPICHMSRRTVGDLSFVVLNPWGSSRCRNYVVPQDLSLVVYSPPEIFLVWCGTLRDTRYVVRDPWGSFLSYSGSFLPISIFPLLCGSLRDLPFVELLIELADIFCCVKLSGNPLCRDDPSAICPVIQKPSGILAHWFSTVAWNPWKCSLYDMETSGISALLWKL